MRASRSMLAITGVVLAGGLIAMTNPKIARATNNAISAVLVTNTAANPVQVAGSVSVSATNPLPVTTSGTVSVTAASPVPITAAGPLVTQSVAQQAANLVELFCRSNTSGQFSCVQVLPGGGVSGAMYVVPTGQTLVITDIDVRAVPSTTGGTTFFSISPVQSTCTSCVSFEQPLTYDIYDVAENDATHHFSLQRGIAWPSGAPIQGLSTLGTVGYLYGYLTTT